MNIKKMDHSKLPEAGQADVQGAATAKNEVSADVAQWQYFLTNQVGIPVDDLADLVPSDEVPPVQQPTLEWYSHSRRMVRNLDIGGELYDVVVPREAVVSEDPVKVRFDWLEAGQVMGGLEVEIKATPSPKPRQLEKCSEFIAGDSEKMCLAPDSLRMYLPGEFPESRVMNLGDRFLVTGVVSGQKVYEVEILRELLEGGRKMTGPQWVEYSSHRIGTPEFVVGSFPALVGILEAVSKSEPTMVSDSILLLMGKGAHSGPLVTRSIVVYDRSASEFRVTHEVGPDHKVIEGLKPEIQHSAYREMLRQVLGSEKLPDHRVFPCWVLPSLCYPLGDALHLAARQDEPVYLTFGCEPSSFGSLSNRFYQALGIRMRQVGEFSPTRAVESDPSACSTGRNPEGLVGSPDPGQ